MPAKRAARGHPGDEMPEPEMIDQPFDELGDSGLTDYERQRLELMRKNLDRMHDLQLPALAASLPPARATKATARGLPAAKKGWVRERIICR